jgi:hypothetical protein
MPALALGLLLLPIVAAHLSRLLAPFSVMGDLLMPLAPF